MKRPYGPIRKVAVYSSWVQARKELQLSYRDLQSLSGRALIARKGPYISTNRLQVLGLQWGFTLKLHCLLGLFCRSICMMQRQYHIGGYSDQKAPARALHVAARVNLESIWQNDDFDFPLSADEKRQQRLIV